MATCRACIASCLDLHGAVSRHGGLLFTVKLARSPRIYCLNSYTFNSIQLSGCHREGHHVNRPAARRQQGNHEDEEQVAHGGVDSLNRRKFPQPQHPDALPLIWIGGQGTDP